MAVLASKLIAINIIDVPDGPHQAAFAEQSYYDRDSQIQLLQSQVAELQQWKSASLPVPNVAAVAAPASPPSSVESAPESSSGDSLSSIISSSKVREAAKSQPRKVKAEPTASPTPFRNVSAEEDVTSRIMSIIESYGQNEENSQGNAWLSRFKFEPRVRRAVDAKIPVPLVLPAFPWKSVNKKEKVLGAVPDLGEVLGLGRLNGLCEDIERIYPPGAKVTITSDGLVYNDLLGISDEEVYGYGSALRRIPEEHGYKNLDFIRIMNLLGMSDQAYMSKEEYLAKVGKARDLLVSKYLDPTFVAEEAIEEDMDITLTYRGYMKFLIKDLKHSPVTAGITGKNEYRRAVKQVAQNMIIRGKAFAAAIEDVLPNHVRLSIHRSTGLNKLSFPLVPQPNHFSMTPWHCCIAVSASGHFRTAHKEALVKTHDVVYHDDRPYYFRDRSPLWDWQIGPVTFEFAYPKTLIVKADVKEGEPAPKLGSDEIDKLKELGKGFTPVIALGFANS